ncbi:hypothetical protein [Pseudoalteromonas peptidolytica]|uniref:hypothetical protein n=1 Tax=Pseudoalteromonas peptidolytica TaxID=61150 RepID=UPI00298DEE12|nr:hypothetical protein [Pseudoalteromonas peptidolytica]MDW7548179.1 hypothetical protein [Pseudoalteromonas peptidolytica]
MTRTDFVNDTAQLHAYSNNRSQPNEADFAFAEIVTQQHEEARAASGRIDGMWLAAPVNTCYVEEIDYVSTK